MLRTFPIIISFFLTIGTLLQADTPYPNIAPTGPKSPEEERLTFKLPAGFEVQLVASDPDICKPIQIAFDAKNRLWVTTSEEYPFPAKGRPGKDRLYVLEDFGTDGKAKKISIFADDLNIPIGVLPLPDGKSVIVSSIDPGDGKAKLECWIWKLTDTDGDGKYDKKEKLYGPFGCDDTHGMNNSYTLMPDGWVYACHGFKNDSRPKGSDGHAISMNSGNTFRFRPDGTRIEIWTRGQVNPFGIAVDPWFNLYTADCHSKPITQLIPGAVYQSFGKAHDGLGFAPHVTIHGHDSTALCGLVYYCADHFPPEYADSMFLGNVTSNCINLDKIEFTGATPRGIDKGQFLKSSDLWFRPTDIKLGTDGALYFADFYNKIIGHYEVDLKHPDRDKLRGRVWRIVYRGVDGKADAPKMKIDAGAATVAQLYQALGSPNLAARLQSLHQLLDRGEAIMPELQALSKDDASLERTALYTWIQGRFDHKAIELPSAELFEKLAAIENPMIAVHTIKVHNAFDLGADFDAKFAKLALEFKNARSRLAAAQSLIPHSTSDNIRALLAALTVCDKNDVILRLSLRIALREAVLSLDNWEKAAEPDPWTADQLKLLADVALAAPTRASAEFLAFHLGSLSTDITKLAQFIEHAARYSDDADARHAILTFIKIRSEAGAGAIKLFAAHQQGLQKVGETLDKKALVMADELIMEAIFSKETTELQSAIDLAVSLKMVRYAGRIGDVVQDPQYPEALRMSASAALATLDPSAATPILARLLNRADLSMALREKAAQTLAATNDDAAYEELVKSFQTAPARLQTAIAVAMANNNKGAEVLLKAVEGGKASARLLQDNVVQAKLKERNLPKTAERMAALTKGLPSPDEKMNRLLLARRNAFPSQKGDAILGKQVFTKNCAICHQIGNEGTKIGPQLDGIGGRGLDRLLEDVLDPNRNVDAAFRTSIITLNDGKNLSGLVLREEGEVLIMADDKGKEVRIPKKEIEEKRISPLSPMPANIAEAISEKDFYDLFSYLLTQRAK